MKRHLFLFIAPVRSVTVALSATLCSALADTNDVQLEISRDANVIQLDWSPARGVLQSAPNLDGPWSNISADNPSWYLLNPANAFYRVLDDTNDILALNEGSDLYHTAIGLMPLTIPPDFFGPGSQPFVGTVQLAGLPLETAGPFELGTADTVIRRLDPLRLPPPDSTIAVPIEMVALSLVSVNPITVTYPSGPSQQWQVFVQPGALSPAAALGQMTLHRSGGSTFDVQLPVLPTLIFSNNLAGTRTMTLPVQTLQGSNGVWSANGGCATDSLRVPRLPLGFCMQNIQLSSSQLQLLLFAPSATTHPPPNVDPSATIDPNVASLGRFCTISGGAYVGASCVVGPSAFLGSNAVVGTNVLIGANVVIGEGTLIGDNTIINDDTKIGVNSTIGGDVVIGASSQVGSQFQIGNNSRIGDQAFVGNLVQIGSQVRCGQGVNIGDGATIRDGLFLVDGAHVGPGVTQDNSLFLCGLPDGTNIITTITNCEALDGFVFGLLSESNRPIQHVITVVKSVTNLVWNATNPPAGLTNLQNDVNNAGGTTNYAGGLTNRIKDREYVTDTYDCDDFAGDMEKALQALGYDATFTVYWRTVLNPKWRWWMDEEKTPKYITIAHALTDVHTDEGIVWIEPQTGKVGVDLDFDGDGKTEYDTKHPGENTDDDGRIEVYDSRAAAEKAGVVMD
jgi:carbonic anhydrase/acetyltransferase-like protein (isoleucine patch superfamily)